MLKITEEKKHFRSKLSRLPLSPEATAHMHALLTDLPEWKRAKRIFSYISVDPEPDTLALIRLLQQNRKQVSVPRVYGKSRMLAHIIASPADLSLGPLGIPQPATTSPVMEAPDIAIVPCLACDIYGNRLGHGGGYYDRYLSVTDCFSICLCPDALLFDDIPHDEHDFKPDVIVTQTRVLRKEVLADENRN